MRRPDLNLGTHRISTAGTAGFSFGSWNQTASPPWLIHLFYCHFCLHTDGGGSCQNKLGQASQPENTNCLDVFACLFAYLSFYSCRLFPWGLGVTGEWSLSQRQEPSP